MSRPPKRDFDYNSTRFVELMNIAIGESQQTTFAEKIGIRPNYLNRIIRLKTANPPSPELLCEIAKASNYRVQYRDLLEACGYNPEKYTYLAPDNFKTKSEYTLRNILYEIFPHSNLVYSTDLQAPKFKKAGIKCREVDIADFYVVISNPEPDINLQNWYFKCLSGMIDESLILQLFGQMVLHEFSFNTKYTFITDSNKIYDLLCTYKPYSLPILISVALINPKEKFISTETYLPTSFKTENILSENVRLAPEKADSP